MLKKLWLRWQCWWYDICPYCGRQFAWPVYPKGQCPECSWWDRFKRAEEMRRISAAVRAMRGKP